MKPAEIPPFFQEEPVSKVTAAFRELRAQLEKEGYFERNWFWDAFYVLSIFFLCGLGTALAKSHPIIAIVLIGLGMQQAGWIGHDYVHGRGRASYVLGRVIGGLFNGFSATWWSNKHNTHHVHTNQMGVDADIANDPILHLWIPDPSKEFPFRKYQHLYYHFVYSFLYASWRLQSFQWSWERKYKLELFLMLVDYIWLLMLPLEVSIGSILFGGLLVAEIVTATHQSEEILPGISFNFIEDQFATTRDVKLENAFFNWLWGGMQYQLEHHLFPTMPKYRYAAVAERVQQFAKENGVEYRASPAVHIFKMNYTTMKKFAAPCAKDHSQ
jgi:fatty acid desaturase